MGFFKLLILALMLIFVVSFLYAILIFLGVVPMDEKDVNAKLLIPGYALFAKVKKSSNK